MLPKREYDKIYTKISKVVLNRDARFRFLKIQEVFGNKTIYCIKQWDGCPKMSFNVDVNVHVHVVVWTAIRVKKLVR